MSGLLRPKSGTVQLNGVDVALRRPSTLQEICIVPEEFDLPRVSLRQYVALNAPFYPRFSNEILRRCLDDFDMDDSVRFEELSMGQKKKAFMSFCLAANTSILLMDEPTNGFDIPSKSQMRKVIAANMSDEKSIVISTHQVRDVENLLDHVLLIDGGRKLLDVSCSQIAERLFLSSNHFQSQSTRLFTRSRRCRDEARFIRIGREKKARLTLKRFSMQCFPIVRKYRRFYRTNEIVSYE